MSVPDGVWRPEAAIAYLRDRLRRNCDDLGNGRRPGWNLDDVAAIRTLLRELERLQEAERA